MQILAAPKIDFSKVKKLGNWYNVNVNNFSFGFIVKDENEKIYKIYQPSAGGVTYTLGGRNLKETTNKILDILNGKQNYFTYFSCKDDNSGDRVTVCRGSDFIGDLVKRAGVWVVRLYYSHSEKKLTTDLEKSLILLEKKYF